MTIIVSYGHWKSVNLQESLPLHLHGSDFLLGVSIVVVRATSLAETLNSGFSLSLSSSLFLFLFLRDLV